MIEYGLYETVYHPGQTMNLIELHQICNNANWRVVGSAIYSQQTGGGLSAFKTEYRIVFTLERFVEK